MAKKKGRNFETDLIASGVGLSVGSTVVGGLPASAASAGVQAGLGTAGAFFSPMVNIHMGGKVVKGFKSLKEVRK